MAHIRVRVFIKRTLVIAGTASKILAQIDDESANDVTH